MSGEQWAPAIGDRVRIEDDPDTLTVIGIHGEWVWLSFSDDYPPLSRPQRISDLRPVSKRYLVEVTDRMPYTPAPENEGALMIDRQWVAVRIIEVVDS